MKRNKNRIPQPKSRIRLGIWLIALTAALIFFAVIIASFNCLKKMDCFKVNQVFARYGNKLSVIESEKFSYLKGKNIFKIDLVREAANICRFYPAYKKIRLTRFLPDKIVVDLLQRKPLAAVKSSKVLFIDEHLVLFELEPKRENLNVPLICGLEKKLNGVHSGQRLSYPELVLALDIIKKINSNSALKDYPIASVEVVEPGNMSVFMLVQKVLLDYTNVKTKYRSYMIEVKLGQEDIVGKVSLLATLLRQVRNNLPGIKYIDLRFKEPVIKLKNSGQLS